MPTKKKYPKKLDYKKRYAGKLEKLTPEERKRFAKAYTKEAQVKPAAKKTDRQSNVYKAPTVELKKVDAKMATGTVPKPDKKRIRVIEGSGELKKDVIPASNISLKNASSAEREKRRAAAIKKRAAAKKR